MVGFSTSEKLTEFSAFRVEECLEIGTMEAMQSENTEPTFLIAGGFGKKLAIS